MNIFTQEDLRNIAVLIQKSTISGAGAMTVALLMQKISEQLVPEEKKEEKKTK